MKTSILKKLALATVLTFAITLTTLSANAENTQTYQEKGVTTVVTTLKNGETIKAKYKNKKLIWFEIYDVNGKPKPTVAFKR